jgi:hypothetical protein
MIALSLAICAFNLVLAGMSVADQNWVLALSQLNVAVWSGLAANLQHKLNKYEQ